jgi:hypothetical protein
VPAVDIPVSLHHLFQSIGPIDNRLQGARLSQFLEYDEIRWHRSRKRVVDRGDLAAQRQRALRVHEGARALSPTNGIEDDVLSAWQALLLFNDRTEAWLVRVLLAAEAASVADPGALLGHW